MQNPDLTVLPIAIRVYPEAESREQNKNRQKQWRNPDGMLVFDTETRVDPTQALTFGSYRLFRKGRYIEEGIFYGDDLPEADRRFLKQYVSTHGAETARNGVRELQLLTRSEFVDKLFIAAYKCRYLLVAFNWPFDISRIACGFANARGRFAGGFSLYLWSYIDAVKGESRDKHRPSICIKHIDSKRALKAFTSRLKPDSADLIPEDPEAAEADQEEIFRGHFLDLRTLAFALTDRGYSLESACEAFGVEHGKQSVKQHGIVAAEYIDYNRRDVLATAELAVKLLEEYGKHPIALQPTKAYSPASIGKAYLRGMGIIPVLERQPDFPKAYLGYAQSAFYGGRTSAHIRKLPIPVVYTDFLSMYPTVNSLMRLWQFVTARKVQIVEQCQGEIRAFLETITREQLFIPDTWKHFAAFVKLIPDGDILPSRSKYSTESNDWQVAVNYISADTSNSRNGLWFSLPDVIASVILTGRVPNIVDAFRIEPVGTLAGLTRIELRGAIQVDPAREDFFKVVIEERKRLGARDLSQSEKDRLGKALKVLANSASYGIYAEQNRQESDKGINIICHGIDLEPYTCRVAHPENPGEYCFPPLAALITGAARLMLALLERSVSDLGGTYAMEDTDSMAIVATERGGLVSCPGGSHRTSDGQPGIKGLSWKQVKQIATKFEALNPYARDAVPGSILKIEADNFDPKTGKQRQLYCLAISAKRYALFLKDDKGKPILLRKGVNNDDDRWSEHGLGHLLNPTDPESEDREWIAQVWLRIIRRALGLRTQKLPFENSPAVGRVSVSSPVVMRPLAALNEGKKYADQIKPFNFLVTCHVKPLGHPTGADPQRFHLIAPYESDPRKWLKNYWIDQYTDTGNHHRITTDGHHGGRNLARVKTYGDVIQEYEFHAESKCADAGGQACDKQTIGLLQRRHIFVEFVKYIGKESNSLEDVDAGLIHSEHGVYTEYPDTSRDEWQTKILPALMKLPLSILIKESGMSRRALYKIRAGRRPYPKNRERLTAIVRECA